MKTTRSVGIAVIVMLMLWAGGASARERVYYFQNDHLGTPQTMTDQAGTVVWQAEYEPFGKATLGTATITNNLRFPGQYYDAETGLHYNWHRTYDPDTGRYLQPDPIGLGGGANLYLYALGNPITLFDFWGLKPGDRFSTIQSAAIDAIDYIHPRSMSERREYAGWIVKRKEESQGCDPKQDYYYTYDEPTPGGSAGFEYELPQPGDHAGAWYHTHPLVPGYAGEKFSPGDMKYSREHGYVIGYLGTPTGHILRYVPSINYGENGTVSKVR